MADGALVVHKDAQRPLLVLNGLNEDELARALTLIDDRAKPPPPTKLSLMLDAETMQRAARVAAYLESRPYVSNAPGVFSQPLVGNHFDCAMVELLEPDERFSINEWFFEYMKTLPPEVRRYEPSLREQDDSYMPMPEWRRLNIDWLHALVETELRYAGFIKLLANCVDMQETLLEEMARYRIGGGAPARVVPGATNNSDADVNVTTSMLLGAANRSAATRARR